MSESRTYIPQRIADDLRTRLSEHESDCGQIPGDLRLSK